MKIHIGIILKDNNVEMFNFISSVLSHYPGSNIDITIFDNSKYSWNTNITERLKYKDWIENFNFFKNKNNFTAIEIHNKIIQENEFDLYIKLDNSCIIKKDNWLLPIINCLDNSTGMIGYHPSFGLSTTGPTIKKHSKNDYKIIDTHKLLNVKDEIFRSSLFGIQKSTIKRVGQLGNSFFEYAERCSKNEYKNYYIVDFTYIDQKL